MHINWLLVGIVAAFVLISNFVRGWCDEGERIRLERETKLVGRSLAGSDPRASQKGPWE